MKYIEQEIFSGERALFQGHDLQIVRSTFADGESPLKEGSQLDIDRSLFKWKYPLWYSRNVKMKDSVLFETARSGIWYTEHIGINDTTIEAPKTFRRSSHIQLHNVNLPNARETLWHCRDVELKGVTARGDYFGMDSEDIRIDGFRLTGNYAFDGAKNIEVRNATLLSKDAFWNCEHVTVYDSVIVGEYIGWNSKNITFINCLIESDQGFCYMDHLVIRNSQLLNTTLAFEYSIVDVEASTEITSVKNPASGRIVCPEIGELIMDKTKIDPSQTEIITNSTKFAT